MEILLKVKMCLPLTGTVVRSKTKDRRPRAQDRRKAIKALEALRPERPA